MIIHKPAYFSIDFVGDSSKEYEKGKIKLAELNELGLTLHYGFTPGIDFYPMHTIDNLSWVR